MGHIRYIVFPSDGLRNVYKCFYSSGKIITIAIINRAVRDTIGKIKLDDKVSESIGNRFNNLGCMYNIMKKIIVESLDNLDECCMALVYLDSGVSIKDVVYSVMKNAISTEFMFIKKVVQKRCIEYALAFIVNVLFISNIVGALNSGKPFSHYMGAFVIFICLKIFIMSVAKSYLMEITIKGYLKERRLYSAEELSNK